MPSKKEVAGNCQVCNEISHGFHFGVIACRACAAFFRRTVALSLKYKCRFDGHCLIDKSMRCMCRQCRHNKCLKVGMKPESVQLNRDNIGHIPRKGRKTVIVQHSSPSSSVCSGKSFSPSPSSPNDSLMARVNNIFEQALLRNDRVPMPSILDEMLRGYREAQNMRPVAHANSNMIQLTGTETEQEEIEINLANCETFKAMIAVEVELAAHMVTYFRPFMDLPSEERMLLFQRFWPHFLKLDRAYTTYLKLGPDIHDERMVIYNGNVVHQKNFISVLAQLSKVSKSELEKLFSSSTETSMFFVTIPLKLLRPTEFELVAMCGHLLWTAPGLKGLSMKTLEIAREVKAEIYTALHRYYVQVLNLHVYAPRIGEFLSLLAAVERSVAQRKEDAMIIDLFDLFKVDMKMMDLTYSNETT